MKSQILRREVYEKLPEILVRLVSPFEGREKDIVLLSSLSVLSSVIPKVYGIYGSQKVYANLYILIIAPPASGKGRMNLSRFLIQKIDNKVYTDSKNASQRSSDENTKIPNVVKIIPANISSAELNSMLDNVHDSGIMIESEADTLSVMFKNDWSNFSDVLRKAFHHEPIAMGRKTEELIKIDEPKLSLLLSGTPDQIQPLIQSKDNGLFSRFAYYSFSESNPWKDVFKESRNLDDLFKIEGDNSVFSMYGDLYTRANELEFKFTEQQKTEFNKIMDNISKIVKSHHPKIFDSNVIRHGLIFFRLCMIFTVLRNQRTLKTCSDLVCNEDDFNTAQKIIRILLYHALDVLYLMGEKGLPALDENVLSKLNDSFERKDAILVGRELEVPDRTLDDKLIQWVKKKVIQKINHGKYEKL